MSDDAFSANEPVLLTGPSGVKGLKLSSVVASETLGRPYRIELELVSEDGFVAPDKVMGRPMAVLVNVGEGARHFHGLVSELYFLGTRAGGGVLYRVLLRPWVWFLSRSVNARIFQNKSAPDIIREVFSGHDFSDVEVAPLGAHAARDFVVQYRESDLSFVTRLMEEEGLYYYFKHTAERHVLVLCDNELSHTPVPGFESLPYFPPGSRRREFVPHIDGWEVTSRVEANVHASSDFDFTKPTAPLRASQSADAGHALGNLEIYDYHPGQYTTLDEGDARARLRVDEQRAMAQVCEGHAIARTIVSGALLTMTKHPIDECNGQFLVVSTVLRMRSHGIDSGGAGPEELGRCDFMAIPARSVFRLSRTTPKPHIAGVQTAIVTGPEGKEIWCDSYGRVRIKFHWDRRKDVTGDEASCWVRVSQIAAGAGFGGINIPRVGQEVIVEFLEGDPDRPIITGRVYNGVNAPPYTLPEHQTQSGIKTATVHGSVQSYNELRFEDEKGKEEVFIQAERDKTTKVKRNRAADVGGSDTLSVAGDRAVTIVGDLSVTVGDKGGKYKLDAAVAADVIAPDYIELRCQGTVLRLTPEAITLTAGGKASLVLDSRVFAQATDGSSLLLDAAVKAISADGAQLQLDAGVTVQGEQVSVEGNTMVDLKSAIVKLNC